MIRSMMKADGFHSGSGIPFRRYPPATLGLQLFHLGRKVPRRKRRQVMRSRIEPTKKIACSLRQHRELILNYLPRRQNLWVTGVSMSRLTKEPVELAACSVERALLI